MLTVGGIAAAVSVALIPVSAVPTRRTAALPAGIWHTDEEILKGPEVKVLKEGDTGSTVTCEMCPGYSLSSQISRPNNSPATDNGFTTSDIASYQVKWTWQGTSSPMPVSIQNAAHSQVSILAGASPDDDNSGTTPGATAVAGNAVAKTYGTNPKLYDDKLTTEVIVSNGYYSKSHGHTVAFVRGQTQQAFSALASFTWYEN